MRRGIGPERLARATDRLEAHHHRLGGGGAFVEQRGVRHREPGEVLDHRLVVDERLETALRDLCLVRRVGGVPARVLEHVAEDHRRRDRVVVALPDEGPQHLVVGGEVLELLDELVLPEGFAELERLFQPDRGRDRRVRELVQALVAERGEHLGDLGLAGRDVATRERV